MDRYAPGMNIVDPILFQAKLNPAAPAICVPGAARPLISYGRLERAIHNISRAALEDIPELPWFIPGMLPPSEPAEQPARAIAAATVAAEMVSVFFIKIRSFKYQTASGCRCG